MSWADYRTGRQGLTVLLWYLSPQVHDFGDLSYLVAANYKAHMLSLLQRATLRSTPPHRARLPVGATSSNSAQDGAPHSVAAGQGGWLVATLDAASASKVGHFSYLVSIE